LPGGQGKGEAESEERGGINKKEGEKGEDEGNARKRGVKGTDRVCPMHPSTEIFTERT